jgi:hypothetical protein
MPTRLRSSTTGKQPILLTSIKLAASSMDVPGATVTGSAVITLSTTVFLEVLGVFTQVAVADYPMHSFSFN